MAGAKLDLKAKWTSPHGETEERILSIKPLTMVYHQLCFNGTTIDIDIINNRNTLKTLIEMLLKDLICKKMHPNGKLTEHQLVLELENTGTHQVVVKNAINLYIYNLSMVDLNNESDVYRALVSRAVRFVEMCCTMFVKE